MLARGPVRCVRHCKVETKDTMLHTRPGEGKVSWKNAVWGAKVLFGSVIAFITRGAIDSEGKVNRHRLEERGCRLWIEQRTGEHGLE